MAAISHAGLKRGRPPKKADVLKDVTIRDFSGGWNVIDSDLNLSSKFAKRLINWQRDTDGGMGIRPGTKKFADTNTYLDEIIHIAYYNGFLVAIGANGKLVSVDSVGSVLLIWDDNWAAALPGAPLGWSTGLTYASSTIYNGDLIICNGIDKPLRINSSMTCQYLTDLGTGSNANTPICRYVATQGRYLLMAGDPDNEDRLHISGTDNTTFVNDPATDAVQIDLGSRVPSGSPKITGIGTFRTNVIVTFAEALLPGTLGTFESGDHVPDFSDAIEGHGSISHKSIQTLGEDMFFCDATGVTSVERALFTGNVRAERFSQLIDPEVQAIIDGIGVTSVVEDGIWSVYDSQSSNYMLFIPDSSSFDDIVQYRCIVLKKNDSLKIEAWADWQDWKFRTGCRSANKRIFLCEGTIVYLMGETHNRDIRTVNLTKDSQPFPRDRIGVEEMFDDNTCFTDYRGLDPVADAEDSGVCIRCEWLFPWADNGSRAATKTSRYLGFDTEGAQQFTVQMFCDNRFEDRTDPGEEFEEDPLLFDDDLGFDVEVLAPVLEQTYMGGDYGGLGLEGFGEFFGGGRNTSNVALYSWVTKYKLYRLRITADAYRTLKISSLTMLYTGGSVRP
jgi:hypothetical protein